MAGAGRWMKTYGETVYGTRAGEIAPGAWGVSTRKGDRLFVHVSAATAIRFPCR